MEPNQIEPTQTLPPPPHRSRRIFHPSERYLGTISEDVEEMFLIDNGVHGDDPKMYNEAISDIDSEKWLEAMKSEIDSMYSNQVWILVDPSEDIVPIRCKWIYKRNIGTDGNVEIFKARLVAKGYSQCKGIDYQDTFFLVVMLKSIYILLAVAAYFDYEI